MDLVSDAAETRVSQRDMRVIDSFSFRLSCTPFNSPKYGKRIGEAKDYCRWSWTSWCSCSIICRTKRSLCRDLRIERWYVQTLPFGLLTLRERVLQKGSPAKFLRSNFSVPIIDCLQPLHSHHSCSRRAKG